MYVCMFMCVCIYIYIYTYLDNNNNKHTNTSNDLYYNIIHHAGRGRLEAEELQAPGQDCKKYI